MSFLPLLQLGGTLLSAFGGGQAKGRMPGAGALEQQGGEITGDMLKQLLGMLGQGAGEADVAAGAEAQRNLAAAFGQAAQTSGLPTEADIASSSQFAQQMFAPQQLAMQQAFQDQSTEAARQAAMLGRNINDPILQAKLAQEQTRQSALLQSQQGAFAAQQAQQMPMQRLQLLGGQADILGGLGQQAFANRQMLLQMGQGVMQGQQANRQQQYQSSIAAGGGASGAIGGLLAGAGTFFNQGIAQGMGTAFGGGSQPALPQGIPTTGGYNPNLFQGLA